jgi:tyrosine-protein kinase Etk/Wzc
MTNAPSSEDINLLEVLLVLARQWKMMASVTLAAAVITALVSLLMPDIYTAKAMILPGEEGSGGMMGTMMAQMGNLAGLPGGGGATRADLYATMLKSDSLKNPIIDRFKLMELYEAKYRANAQSALAEDSSISIGKKDGVITIAVDNENPKLAAGIANAYVEELGKMAAQLGVSGAGTTRAFLEERLGKAKADLAASEETLKNFQSRNKAVAVPEQAKSTLEGVAQLRAQLAAQEVQLASLQQQFSPQSREIRSSKATIGNLRGQIARLEGGGGGAFPGVGAVPELGQEYVRLMREFKVQETLVELLTKQYEMAKMNEAKDMAPFQVLQRATVPELKSRPKRGMLVVAAAMAAFSLTLAFALLREMELWMNEENRRRWRELKATFTPVRSGSGR